MKRMIAAAAAVAALSAAALPAAAQPWRDDYRADSWQSHRLEERIDRMARQGRISWREARSLRHELAALERLEWRYGRDGLSNWERRDLDRRYAWFTDRLREEARDGDRRYGYGYGWR